MACGDLRELLAQFTKVLFMQKGDKTLPLWSSLPVYLQHNWLLSDLEAEVSSRHHG